MKLTEAEARLFDRLYRKHAQEVFRHCLRFAAGDRAWAKDRMQDTFLKTALHLKKLKDPEDLGGWLYRVAARECLMALRKGRGWRQIQKRLGGKKVPANGAVGERLVQSQRDVSALEHAISDLPAKQQAVMVLIYLDGKAQKEAGEVLGYSKGQISKLHRRALERLKAGEWELIDA